MEKIKKEYYSLIKNDLNNDDFDYVIKGGWDYNVILVNNEFVYRFPKNKEFLDKLEEEKLLLDLIKKYVYFSIPEAEIISKKCLKYKIIKGEIITKEKFYNLPKKYKEKFLDDIVFFMKQMHNIPILEAKKILKSFDVKDYVEKINLDLEKKLKQEINQDKIQNLQNYVREFYNTKFDKVALIHKDLNLNNIIFDFETNRISGIIDFSGALISGLEIEFMPFVKFENNFLEKMIIKYLGKDNKKFADRIIHLSKRNLVYKINNDKYFYKNKAKLLFEVNKF